MNRLAKSYGLLIRKPGITMTTGIIVVAIILIAGAGVAFIAYHPLGTGKISTESTNSARTWNVQVVSAKFVPPVVPAGPTVELTLQNQGGCCITSLTATLVLGYRNYTFVFKGVNASNPLDQGQSASDTEILTLAGFGGGQTNLLIVNGTARGLPFSDDLQVQVAGS
jgi:hypothetical protein